MVGLIVWEICLCNECEKKLQDGKITEYDIEISRILYKLFGTIENGFVKSIIQNNTLIIFAERNFIGKMIGVNGENIKKISKHRLVWDNRSRSFVKVIELGEDDLV